MGGIDFVEILIFLLVLVFFGIFLAQTVQEVVKMQVDHPDVCYDPVYFRQGFFVVLHNIKIINTRYVQKDGGSSIFKGFPFEELVGGGVDYLEVTVVEGGYFVDFLRAEGSAVGGLAQGNHLSIAAAAVAPTERPFHSETVPARFLLQSVVNQQQFFFEIFLQTSNIVVELMGIALFLNSGDLFGEQIDGFNAEFVVIELLVNIRQFL